MFVMKIWGQQSSVSGTFYGFYQFWKLLLVVPHRQAQGTSKLSNN